MSAKSNSDPLNALGLAQALRAMTTQAMQGPVSDDLIADAWAELSRHDRACARCAPCLAPGQRSLELEA